MFIFVVADLSDGQVGFSCCFIMIHTLSVELKRVTTVPDCAGENSCCAKPGVWSVCYLCIHICK